MRVIKQLRNEVFMCKKRLQNLVYDKKGNWKKGLDKRDKRIYHRMFYQLGRIKITNAEGYYLEPNEMKKYIGWREEIK